MAQLYILFEHASGYALFRTTEFEEISTFLPQVKKSIQDISKFRSVVHLISFQPFKTGQNALENVNSLSEGLLHPHLQLFLETNVPKSKKKKQPVILGIADSKLGALITETLGITCTHIGAVPEIIRGIRFHFYNLVKGFKDLNAAVKAQLGLGHHYSRAKVKFNVNRVDNMIIQSISIVDQLDKDINTFSMRVREWYSYHFPELIKIVPENALYVRCVGIIRDRKNMPEDVEEQLENILMDSTKVQNVMSVARSSMGMEISPLDMENVTQFAERITSLVQRRKELMEYLKSKMHNVAPNLAMLIGDMVGARLISHAGSLTNLAKYPASTVQIIGAEKALFRALKTKGNTPKYGLIYHSTFIGRATKENKGRISRYLANKCSMASRIDCFSEIPTEVYGTKLRQQVEDRIKFYETGTVPAKNIDVMTEATDEATVVQASLQKRKRKEEKKAKKKKQIEMGALTESMVNSTHGSSFFDTTNENGELFAELAEEDQTDISLIPKKKKKKKQKADVEELADNVDNAIKVTVVENGEVEEPPLGKKKKKRKIEEVEQEQNEIEVEEQNVSRKKKKRKAAVDF